MTDIKSTHGAFDRFDNDLVLVDGGHDVAQNIDVRLRTLAGEYFADARLGTPWLQELTSSLVSEADKRSIFISIIQKTEGVARVLELKINGNKVDFKALLDDGTIIQQSTN